MTDMEMLELAAKAAGIEHLSSEYYVSGPELWDIERKRWWRPLTNDGDALRLAAALSMRVDFCSKTGCAARYGVDCENVIYVLFDANRDLLQASRMAITKAAAEIGAQM